MRIKTSVTLLYLTLENIIVWVNSADMHTVVRADTISGGTQKDVHEVRTNNVLGKNVCHRWNASFRWKRRSNSNDQNFRPVQYIRYSD